MNKKFVKSLLIADLVLISAIIFTGCGRKESHDTLSDTELDQKINLAIQQAFETAYEVLLQNAQTNAAIEQITAFVNTPQYQGYRYRIFPAYIEFLLTAGQIDQAKKLVADAVSREPLIAVPALDLVYEYMVNAGGYVAPIEWLDELSLNENLPVMIKRRLWGWQIGAAMSQNDNDSIIKLLIRAASDLDVKDNLNLFSYVFEPYFTAKQFENIERVLETLINLEPKHVEHAQMAIAVRARLLATKGEWDALPDALSKADGVLTDAQYTTLLQQLNSLSRNANRYDVADVLCNQVIKNLPEDKKSIRVLAARFWAESAVITNQAALPSRIEVMLDSKLDPEDVSHIFQRHYYSIISNPDVLKAMCALGNKMLPQLKEKEASKSLQTMILDGAFILEDYDSAVSILESGIPDRDAEWHKMTLAKVKAHRAMKNNQPREAVEFFREFMGCVQNLKDEDTADPSTGVQHSKDMILGRNAKRIGDILAAIPDKDASTKAYAEARAYYDKALKTANKETQKIIEKELLEFP